MTPGRLEERPAGTDHEPSAGALRNRRLATGIAASLGGKAIALAAPLLMIPVTFQYLGVERYGLWMAVTSLTSMALFADLGLGNGLLTSLSRSYATRDAMQAARSTASAYAVLGALGSVLLLVLLVAGRIVPWPALFNMDNPELASEAPAIVVTCLGSFVVNIPLSLIQRVQYSQQQVAQSNLWQAIASLLSVGLALAGVAMRADYTVVIAGAVLAVPLVNLVNSLFYFGVQNPALSPRRANIDKRTAQDLVGLGLRFFLLSTLTSLALNIDGLLVARILGLDAAAHYAVVARLFGTLSLFVTLVCLPLWPANAEAIARGELVWVRRNTRRMSVLSGCVVAAGALTLTAFGGRLLAVWLRSGATGFTSPQLLGALGISCFLVATTSPLFMVQNSIGLLGPQFGGWAVFLVVSVALKVALMGRLGLAGVPMANCIAYVAALVPAAWVGYQKSLATNSGRKHRVELS
jgi:O-antigen/teichoic acid export membrane protein